MATIKKLLTATLKPGMIVAEDTYTEQNRLVMQKDTILTAEIIQKLRYYSVKSVIILIPDGEAPSTATTPTAGAVQATGTPRTAGTAPAASPAQANATPAATEPTYFERVQNSSEFLEFQHEFTNSLNKFQRNLNDIVIKNTATVVEDMLNTVGKVFDKSRNPLHLLDMMQCMRGFDDMTYTHSMNVALICHVIGVWLNLSPDNLNILVTCGMLHDIGKLKIPNEVITKPGKLTDKEFQLIQMHPQLGYDILKNKLLDDRIKTAALQHHERFDGKGYPQHLSGSSIDYFASIVTIADVYDAMTSDRCYRKGICPFEVIAHLEEQKDLYEPGVLYLFMRRTVEAYINTEVLLSNGERGKVVLLNANLPSRPTVMTDQGMHDLSREPQLRITKIL